RAWESTRDWLGVATPTSHGSMPTQWLETHCAAMALGLVSVSQAQHMPVELGLHQPNGGIRKRNVVAFGHHHWHQGAKQNVFAYPSKQVALQKAKELGCEGVHAMGSLWMPCSEHPSH
ncbi:DUF3721 domain-containing protein, partial [Cyanobium sp. Cruz-8D1]|nr:DUF3721 domain-containing protein [Cyanobium sp. Cruz-8H5]MCP9868096.1 DUF3721 domain-containing protein [Cyanobium sp. Cruz-8D1]